MDLTFNYVPNVGISINGIALNWGIKRDVARNLLYNMHESNDHSFDNIVSKRDVYTNFLIPSRKQPWDIGNMFTLNYDKNDLLSEAEVHSGFKITVLDKIFTFETTLVDVVKELKKIPSEAIKLNEGEYFLKDLKIVASDAEAMGSEGEELGYFYCAANVDHLIE